MADSSRRHDPLELVKGDDDLQIRMKLRCGSMCQCGYGLESLEPKVSQHISTAGEDLKILTWSILIMEFSPLLGVALTCRSTCHQGRRLVKAKKRQRLRKMVFGGNRKIRVIIQSLLARRYPDRDCKTIVEDETEHYDSEIMRRISKFGQDRFTSSRKIFRMLIDRKYVPKND